jgi:hypothetical protein
MLGRLAAAAALIALAGCAGMEPAGRNAARGSAPMQTSSAPVERSAPVTPPPSYVPPPPSSQAYAPPLQPVQQAQAAPPISAASVAAPPPPQQQADPNADVTVQAPARQLEAPRGDSRSVSERREDMQTWDHCVLAVQQTYESDPTEPVLDTPEEVCRRQLGQASRTAVPAARLVRPH